MRDPHEVLGVPRDASQVEVSAAYRALSLRYDPDKHGAADPALRELAAERFHEVQIAYRALASSEDGPVVAAPTETIPPPERPEERERAAPRSGGQVRTPLGEVLVAMGAVSEPKVRVALRHQERGDRRRIGEILAAIHACRPGDVLRALGQQRGMPVVDLDLFHVPVRLAEIVPYRVALELGVVPVKEDSDGLLLAIGDPDRRPLEAALSSRFGRRVTLALVEPRFLASALNSATYGFGPPGGWEKRTLWNRFWQFVEEYPLGPIDWVWAMISKRLPGLSGPAFIVLLVGTVFGIIIASATELGPVRWLGLVPLFVTLAVAGVYRVIRNAIVRRIHK